MRIQINQKLTCLLACLFLGLSSCKDNNHSVSIADEYRLGVKEGLERQPYFEGTLVFNKSLAQSSSQLQSPHSPVPVKTDEELAVKINMVHKELLSIPAIQKFLTGNNVANFGFMAARFNNLNQNLIAQITHFAPIQVNGNSIQQTGEMLMNISVPFSVYYDLQKVKAKTMNMSLAASVVESATINIQEGLKGEYLEATIAHELAHLYVESLYPALAHSTKKTGYGFSEGKAISEGVALCIEKIYLRHKYPEQKDSIFDRIHPSNRVNKATNDDEIPYGDYQRYFETVFAIKAKNGDLYLNTNYIALRNYSICSDLINDLAKTISESAEVNFTEWPSEYKVCNYLSGGTKFEGGHVNFQRGENTIEPFIEKEGLSSAGNEDLARQVAKLENVALELNNLASGLKVDSIYSDGDSVPLIVREVTTVSDFKTQTVGRAFIHSVGSTKQVIKPVGSSLPGLLYDARITCPTPGIITVSPDDLKAANYSNPTKLAILLQNARYMRESTLIHELSHIYLARILPLLNSTDIREGYAVYLEYLYLSKLFASQLREEYIEQGIAKSAADTRKDATGLANDFLSFKYKRNGAQQYTRFSDFLNKWVNPDASVKLDALQNEQNNQLQIILN